MARNKFDVDERLETPFDFRHLKRVDYRGKLAIEKEAAV